MPTVLRIGPYRFFFYSSDGGEPTHIHVERDECVDDGRVISAPLAWFPRLLHGSEEKRSRIRFIGNGEGFHWPDLDEDVSVEALLAGRPSAESVASLKRWLSSRQSAGKEKADA